MVLALFVGFGKTVDWFWGRLCSDNVRRRVFRTPLSHPRGFGHLSPCSLCREPTRRTDILEVIAPSDFQTYVSLRKLARPAREGNVRRIVCFPVQYVCRQAVQYFLPTGRAQLHRVSTKQFPPTTDVCGPPMSESKSLEIFSIFYFAAPIRKRYISHPQSQQYYLNQPAVPRSVQFRSSLAQLGRGR